MRIRLTVLLVALLFLSGYVYDEVQGPLEGSIAVQQLEDDDATYVAARKTIDDKFILQVVQCGLVGLGLLIWAGPLRRFVSQVY